MPVTDDIWIRAPARLSVDVDSVQGTIEFLAEIENASLSGAPRVLLDLTKCTFISRSACLMLTAQIDRSNWRNPGTIGGRNPLARDVCQRLHDFGFYRHLSFHSPAADSDEERRVSISIRSGRGATDDLSERLEEVARLAWPLFDDADIVENVHEALNEAVTNIVGHAYAEEVANVLNPHSLKGRFGRETIGSRQLLGEPAGAPLLVKGRWWFAGYANHQRKELSLFALDHGRSIPSVAPFTMGDALREFFVKTKATRTGNVHRSNAEILEGVARARRLGVGTGRRGKGFPTMIALVENQDSCGEVRVLSGDAIYEFSKVKPKSVPRERSFSLVKPFSGTLIEWRIAIPSKIEREGE